MTEGAWIGTKGLLQSHLRGQSGASRGRKVFLQSQLRGQRGARIGSESLLRSKSNPCQAEGSFLSMFDGAGMIKQILYRRSHIRKEPLMICCHGQST